MTAQDTVRLLAEAARAAPSADNSQPWQFRCSADRFSCAYRESGNYDPFGPGGHATLLSVGALAENLCQLLGGGVGLAVESLVTGDPYFSLSLDAIGQAVEPAAKSHPLFQRHTNRFSYTNDPLPPLMLEKLAGMTEDTARVVLLSDPAARKQFAAIAEVCCRARFCNRELHEWLMNSLRWPNEGSGSDDGLDVATLDLPPGGQTLMRLIRPWRRVEFLNRWLGLYRLMAHTEVQPLRRAPLVACIVGDNTPEGSFSAGRLMQRLWIALNAQGWAVHPYYVVADQHTRLQLDGVPQRWIAPVKQSLAELSGLLRLGANERLHMALRVGLPAKTPHHSGRLSLDKLLVSE